MKIKVSWCESFPLSIRMDFSGEWTWPEFGAAGDEIARLLDEAAGPVCLVLNIRETSFMPPGGFVQNMRHAVDLYHRHANIDAVIVVFGQSEIRDLFSQAFLMYGASNCEYFFVHSLEEARHIIASRQTPV